MNIIKQWMERRRLRKESEAAAKKQMAETLKLEAEEARKNKCNQLRQCVINVSDDLEKIGFKTNQKYATGDELKQATLVAVGPDNRVYILTVFDQGGYKLKTP